MQPSVQHIASIVLTVVAAWPLATEAQTYTASVSSRGGFADVIVPAAGDYSISIAGGPWNAWNGQTGYLPEIDEVVGWLHSYGGVTSSAIRFGTGSARYQSPGAAMSAAPVIQLSLKQPETLRFSIQDPFPSDNVGGLTFSIRKVPCNPTGDSTVDRLSKGFAALQPFLDPGTIGSVIQSYINGGDFAGFVTQLGVYTEQTFGSALSRVGGVIQNLGIGLLDPGVAAGVQQIHQSVTDPRKDVCGLTNAATRDALDRLFREEAAEYAPRMPVETNNGKSRFDVSVGAGQVNVLDPLISPVMTYETAASDPDFQSVVLPYLGKQQRKFLVQLSQGSAGWADYVQADPLREIVLPPGTRSFRVAGINASALPAQTNWIAGVSFSRDGRFTGTISSKTYDFAGFLPPTNLAPTVNSGNSGSSFPIKWTLTDVGGNVVTSLAAIQSLKYRSADCATFTANGSASNAQPAGQSALRYDTTAGQFVFNWKSPGATGCYALTLELADGQVFSSNYLLR